MLTERLSRYLRYVYVFVAGAMVISVLAVAVSSYAATFYQVKGSSMMPTLHTVQLLLVDLLAYKKTGPQDGEMVIVRYAGGQNVRFVKRVVAGPGERVTYQGAELVLGPQSYFVEGDNREFSTDSRSYGPVSLSQILGRAVVIGTR